MEREGVINSPNRHAGLVPASTTKPLGVKLEHRALSLPAGGPRHKPEATGANGLKPLKRGIFWPVVAIG